MLINGGVDPYSNRTVIPSPVLREITTAYTIMLGAPPQEYFSLVGYSTGWSRLALRGHDVCVCHVSPLA